ncbi:serine/arginine repetitive matrix protein 1-like [Hirundo rustica]|uniref:serine/arginine repetitive matrix protein 1-like n=1 Tax=Hirundo rustica TaxID=43150 RepID=UPI001A949C37|nr:serine/arginine repetitive matrix protein 1-like [Hirundo rustica]
MALPATLSYGGAAEFLRTPGSLRADNHPAPSRRLSPREATPSRTTFPSGSSRDCTCSMRLPAPPGSSRRGTRCGTAAASAAPGAAPGAAPDVTGGAALPGAGPGRPPGRLPAVPFAVPDAVPGGPPGAAPRGGILPVRARERTAGPRRRPGPGRSRAAPPRAGSMPRGRAWTQAEVSRLLSLVGDSGEAALLMASTSRPNEALWREISRGLAAHGYGRSVAQCRSKWKALKQAFHSERETRQRAGHPSPRLPPHYRAMKNIWKAAGQPVFGERRMPDVVKLPSRKRRSALTTRSPSSPEPPEHDVDDDTPSTPTSAAALLSPMLQCAKDEPENSGGDHITGVPPTPPAMPHASSCFPLLFPLGCHTDLKQEEAEGKAGFPGETSLGMERRNQMLPLAAAATGSHGTAATTEQPAAGEDASDTSLHGSGVAGLLQNVQQLLVEILQTSRQQQALLESLASNTASHLHNLSHSLEQVGETLHQLLLRPQTHPGPIGH